MTGRTLALQADMLEKSREMDQGIVGNLDIDARHEATEGFYPTILDRTPRCTPGRSGSPPAEPATVCQLPRLAQG